MSPRAAELTRIAASMAVACAAGSLVLGAVHVATDRYAREARAETERAAVGAMLALGPDARVLEVGQYLDRARRQVVYRAGGSAGRARRLVFGFDGRLMRRDEVAEGTPEPRELELLGRLFVATRGGSAPAGFVVEGEARGYKNKIRFLVGIDPSFTITGVQVIEHEEDPGLGAEIARPWFEGQYVGRGPRDLAQLEVTRDPMPEDWSLALARLEREPLARWRTEHRERIERERARPIHAVTGATISSRALTDGVRATVAHFQQRWRLLALALAGAS